LELTRFGAQITERTGKERGDEILRELKLGAGGELRREVGVLQGLVDRQRADMLKLRDSIEKPIGECECREDWTVKLDHENTKLRVSLQEAFEVQDRQARSMQERLEQTDDRGRFSCPQQTAYIVRDLDENIYQAAVSLAEEWGKLKSSQATGRIGVDLTSQLACGQDLTGPTFLLCYRAVNATSSWVRNRELDVLKYVHYMLQRYSPLKFVPDRLESQLRTREQKIVAVASPVYLVVSLIAGLHLALGAPLLNYREQDERKDTIHSPLHPSLHLPRL